MVVEMTREEWRAERRKGVGSSDSAAILGLNPYRTPLHVWLDKTRQLDDADDAPKRWGRLLEDVVAQAFGEETGLPVLPPPAQILWHPDRPCMLASLDRVTAAELGSLEPAVVEAKTTGRFGDEWGEPGTDEVPEYNLVQVQHQLAVTGWRVAWVPALDMSRQLRVYRVVRNEAVIAAIERAAVDFWALVERNVPPTPDWSHAYALDAVTGLYPGVSEVAPVVESDDPALAEAAAMYLRCRERARQARADADAYKARLLYAMGDAGVFKLPGGIRMTRAVRQRAGYAVEPLSYIDFRVKEVTNKGD